jgi:tetratricopeptide (TPR) repeat protein
MTLHNFSSDIPAQALEHFDRGMELLDEGDPREAAAEFLRAIRYDSSVIYQEAELMLATAYRLASDSEDERDLAIKQYQKVTTLDPDDGGSWLWLALLALSNSFKDGELRPGEKAQYYNEKLHPEAIQRAKESALQK